MKKTLIALAALATVSSSFAQSSVTISGFFHGSYDTFNVKSAAATRTGNKSENRVTDNSSRIIFGVVEDLGGGDLSAVGQVDMRFALDAQNRVGPDDLPGATKVNPVSNTFTSGNNHVGLVSKSMGGIRLGRQDIHYTEGGHFNHTSAATIVSSINVLHSNGTAGGSIANWSRTPNLLWYTSPTINGLNATLGYSTNGTRASGGYMEQENDMASNQRKGSTAYQRLAYTNGPLALVYSNISSKSDWLNTGTISAGASVNALGQNRADQKGSVLTAKYTMGQFSVGYAAAQTSNTATATLIETKNSNSQLGLGYTSGKHNLAYTMTNKGDNKVAGVTAANTGAKQTSLVYGYDLSKRTSIGIAMVALTNEASSSNTLFYNGENAVGTYGSTALAGEKHTATAISLKHSF
jgi:predicted porin